MTIARTAPLSLARLLQPEVLANPYPLYHGCAVRRRCTGTLTCTPGWSPRYEDVTTVLHQFLRQLAPMIPRRLNALDWAQLAPIAAVMVKQMLFLDPPRTPRARRLASAAFTPRRVERAAGPHPGDRRLLCRRIMSRGRDGRHGAISPTRCRPS